MYRVVAAAYAFVREATKDTFLTVPNPHGIEGTTSIPLMRGTTVSLKKSQKVISPWLIITH